jgi:hypothetical protein
MQYPQAKQARVAPVRTCAVVSKRLSFVVMRCCASVGCCHPGRSILLEAGEVASTSKTTQLKTAYPSLTHLFRRLTLAPSRHHDRNAGSEGETVR